MRLGILGYGDAGGSFASAAMVAEGVELVMIAGRNVEKASAKAQKFGVAHGSAEDMLARDDIDCVAVSTPPGIHAEGAIPFAEKGVHLMVEKPMCLTVEDCKRVIDAAEKNNVKLMVTQTHRYTTVSREAHRLIESGVFGAPIHITAELFHNYFTAKRSGWQLEFELSGGGVTMNPFIHMIDMARYLALSEAVEWTGKVGHHMPGYDIEGNIQCFARHESGVTSFVHVDGYGQMKKSSATVALEQAMLVIDIGTYNIEIWRNGKLFETVETGSKGVKAGDFTANNGYLRHVEEMREAIEKGAPILSDGYNGMRNVRIARDILDAGR